jgi:hypothetical protein
MSRNRVQLKLCAEPYAQDTFDEEEGRLGDLGGPKSLVVGCAQRRREVEAALAGNREKFSREGVAEDGVGHSSTLAPLSREAQSNPRPGDVQCENYSVLMTSRPS